MKEYKLSAKSKYSVLYLLCGLFMFFFMFAILSLNSHARAVSDYVLNITSSNGTFFETSGLYHSFSASLQHPEYAYPITTVSGSSSFTRPSGVESVNLEVHVVTSQGDFVVDTHQGTGSYEAFSSVKLEGYPIGYYGVCKGYLKEGTSSTTMTMNVSCSATVANQSTNVTNSLSSIQSNTNQILQSLGGGSSPVDYDSYGYLNCLSAMNLSNYGLDVIPAGSATSYTFEGSYSSIRSNNHMVWLRSDSETEYLFTIFSNVLLDDVSIGMRDIENGNVLYLLSLDDFTLLDLISYNTAVYVARVTVPEGVSGTISCSFRFGSSSTMVNPSFSVMSRKYTISDYMQYVKDNYNDISPSVTDTNSNIAQSVSDIGTAQSFETSAFANFDTQFSNSGLDSFSLSFASTPLLWVSSIITTFYNNMPSTFHYLLMFVAFVGILCTVLNVFGRVAQRFGGGDNATKLNSKDVFSKIEKNGSI